MSAPVQPNPPAAGGAAPQRDRKATRRPAHLKFLARRLEGSAPATPGAYARAVQQWQQLPGAVVSVPTDALSRAQASPAGTGPGAAAPAAPESGPGNGGDKS
jgi:hypothetical protein